MAEKTEKATPKKLRDARKKGQVAKAQDFASACTFVTSISLTLALTGFLFDKLGSYMVATFRRIPTHIDLTNGAGGYFEEALLTILSSSLPIMILVALVGVIVNFLIVGPTFSAEALKIDLKRLNPVTNIKNIFKFKTLFELLKSIFKITGAVILIYTALYDSIPEIVATAAMPVYAIAEVFTAFLIKVVIRIGIFFLAVAVIDLIYQRRNFAKEMKMEKFEVKQERKDTEGDPHIKQKRRQTAQELAYQEGPPAARRARTVITNPEHIAVAIEYDESTQPAPRILTMGKGPVAELIIRFAEEAHVPIMRNVALARLLYEKGQISEYIPEETFQAVAEILKWIERIEKEEVAAIDIFKQQ